MIMPLKFMKYENVFYAEEISTYIKTNKPEQKTNSLIAEITI